MRKTYGFAVTLALMRRGETTVLGGKPMTAKRKAQQGKYPGEAARRLGAQYLAIRGVIELSCKCVIIAASSALIDGATRNKLDLYCAPHIFAFSGLIHDHLARFGLTEPVKIKAAIQLI
jgi:hypothetical protein